MTKKTRKFFAVIILILLLVVPFINWRLGAVFWMSAWLTYIFQNLLSRHNWKIKDDNDENNLPD